MSTELTTQQGGALDKYDQAEMVATLKQTVCKGATDAQFRMFVEVCRGTGLNPFLREIWFVPSVGIMAGRDGYLAVANKHPQFDGMETRVDRDEKNVPVKATCTVWRKDRGHAIICEAYYSEYKKSSDVWQKYPSAMISKVAEVLALKRSFAINGVVTEEEIGIGEPEPRGSVQAARAVAEAKISGSIPLVAPEAPAEPAALVDPLAAQLATFTSRASITSSFAEMKKVWLKYESEEAWTATLEQFGTAGIEGNGAFPTVGVAKKCFTALWKSAEKMMLEAQEAQPA